MASIFTRVLDRVTPWDRKGEVQRRQESKKRKEEEEQQRIRAVAPNVQRPQDSIGNQVQQKPAFDLTSLKLPTNTVSLPKPQEYDAQALDNVGVKKPKQGLFDKVRDQFDANTEADKYRRAREQTQATTQQLTKQGVDPRKAQEIAAKQAKQNMRTPENNTIQSNLDVLNRSKQAVGSNFGGGLIGAAKGVVELPSLALNTPKLVRLGAAKLTGNKEAEENIANDQGVFTQLARKYDELVNPVTKRLTDAELATDRQAEIAAPWAPKIVKPSAKVLANIIPVDAAISGLVNLNRARNLEKVFREGETAIGTPPTAGIVPRVVSDNVSDVLSEADINDLVPNRGIDVVERGEGAINVPVRNVTPEAPIIREIGGDAPNVVRIPTPEEVAQQQAASRFAEQSFGRPDDRIEGLTVREPGDPAAVGVTRQEIDAERVALDDALENKEITKTQHKQANKDLDEITPAGELPENSRKIEVKQVDSIPVQENTDVPVNLPETPGKVRVSTQTDPLKAETQAVATQPVVAPTPKVGSILPDGTKVTKRMVQSARNQRKNANAYQKAQQQTADAMEQVNAIDTPNNSLDARQPGLIPSGELKKGRKGVYQTVKQEDQSNELSTKSIRQVIQEADANIKQVGTVTDRDIANVKAALDSGTVDPTSAEYKRLSDLYWKEAGTKGAQRLALRNQASRRVASGKEMSNRAVSKLVALADDPTKITKKQIADINRTADEFARIRDAHKVAADEFNANPTKENYDRFMQLDKEVTKAEKNMALSQYNAAKSALKGNVNVKLKRQLEDAAEESDLYTMDFVDSALLSSTGTFVRNFTNASLASLEEGVFGGIGARAGRTIKGTPIGGGIGRGSLSGFKRGAANIVNASKARAKNAGWNPIEHMKNWSTTGNQLGDSMIEGSVGRSVRNHYEQLLKDKGYSGKELKMRTDVMARQDPENLAEQLYAPQAKKDAGLGSGISKRSTLEKDAQRWVADEVAKVMGKEYSGAGENFAKGVTRIVLGFPSAIARSLAAGSQRVVPFANIDTVKAITANSPTERAAAIKESIKKSGTAATAATVFGVLGANGNITGAYPKDPNERDKWAREGIKENSIKIGDAWYDAPSYLGSFAVPVLAWASIGRHGGVNKESLNDIRSTIAAMSPTENLTAINDALSGKSDFGKYTQNVAASTVRMSTPYGSLLNQLSKVLDPNQKDTSSDSWAGGLLNKMMDGVPFLDNAMLPDKTDKEGNVLKNPSVVETMLGAAGAVQGKGEERSAEIQGGIDSTVKTIKGTGALDDKNLSEILDDDVKSLYQKAKKGDKLDESEIKALKKGLTKGVSEKDGYTTAYLEREEYGTHLTALKLKKSLMEADKSTKPSNIKDIDVAITRGEIFKEKKIPYDLIDEYKSTGVEQWRKYGNPDSEDYDPEAYQRLFEIDKLLTDKKVSYRKGDPEKNKYAAKSSREGGSGGRGGGRGGRSGTTDFGTINSLNYGPKVKEYDSSMMSGASGVPVIGVKRSNIVHKITTSR